MAYGGLGITHDELFLLSKGYGIISMPYDGNCQFHAVSAATSGKYEKYLCDSDHDLLNAQAVVRVHVQEEIQNNLPKYADLLIMEECEDENRALEPIQLKIERIVELGYWGGHTTLAAAAAVYGRSITVHFEGGSIYTLRSNVENVTEPIELFYHDHHYDLLKKNSNLLAKFLFCPPPIVSVKVSQMEPGDNPYNAIASCVKGASKFHSHVKIDLDDYMLWEAEECKDLIKKHFLPSRLKTADKESAINEFYKKMKTSARIKNKFLVAVASRCYKRNIIVYPIRDEPLVFSCKEGDKKETIYLSISPSGIFDILTLQYPF